MIRPFTCVCFLLACGSGLYLYQAKHRVQLLDREIEKTVRATNELRERIRVMHAEWTLQNDPQRLQQLADQLLTLKTVTPGQFTSMADLDNRLPALRPPDVPPPDAPPPVVIAQAPQIEDAKSAAAVTRPAIPPAAPKPVTVAVAAPHVPERSAERVPERPPERKPPSRPVIAETPLVREPPSRPAAAEAPRLVRAAEAPRPMLASAPPRPISAAPGLIGGSALGMARAGSAPPAPLPMPVSASQWVGNGGGG